MSYDRWANIITRNGYKAEELISALQKSIRRGRDEIAVRIAYEMYITSPDLEEKLWRRLMVISVEDVGFGDTAAPVYLHSLSELRKNFPYDDGDRPLFFFAAIRYLCRCQKERSTDHLKNIVIKEFEQGVLPEIPEYAYDMHTARGQAMGRDELHFIDEASRVMPEIESEGNRYKGTLREMIEKELAGEITPIENSFRYSDSQF